MSQVHPLSLPEGALLSVVCFLTLMTSAEGSEAPPKDQREDEAENTSVHEFAFESLSLSTFCY